MNFKNAKELLELCKKYDCPISEIMLRRECTMMEKEEKDILGQMVYAWNVMKDSARARLDEPRPSIGGLIGGEAKDIFRYGAEGKSLCGMLLNRAVAYAVAVLEENASMGLIVAAPTAGSSGVLPGIMLAMEEVYGVEEEKIVKALFNAGALGYLAMYNATVAGAVGGCQAEVGVAAAMAASAAVELEGGTPEQSLNAATTVLMNMLGLICDPVGGLVECPCQMRNAAGVANALVAAEIALSGVKQIIPFDEMLDTMYQVGKRLPTEYRETAMGGCAMSPSACRRCSLN